MRILVFAPHNDDEVLGVGGTIAKYSELGDEVYICEVTSGNDQQRLQRIQSEALKSHEILGVKDTFFLNLPVVGLSDIPTKDLNSAIHNIVKEIKPEVVFLPHKGDMHIDHRLVAESAMVALRPVNNPFIKTIYAYETLSETEWNTPTIDNIFIPTVFSDITDTISIKLDAMECYKSQLKEFPHPRSLEAIKSLAKYRGSTVGVNSAESFMLIRNII